MELWLVVNGTREQLALCPNRTRSDGIPATDFLARQPAIFRAYITKQRGGDDFQDAWASL